MHSITGYVVKKIHNKNGILNQKTWDWIFKALKHFNAKNFNEEHE